MGSGELGLVKVPCVKKKYRKKWTVQTLNKSTKSSAKKNLQIKASNRSTSPQEQQHGSHDIHYIGEK